MKSIKNWKSFNESESSKFKSYEYVDRSYDGKIVQIGMFEKITKKEQIKLGDRFICPSSSEYKSGIVDSNTMKPILLFCEKSSSEHHIGFSTHENSKSVPSIAWDLCYILRKDI
jgi:hypothetical protein